MKKLKKMDILFLCIFVVLLIYALVTGKFAWFKAWTTQSPYLASFVKFAVLATFGECLALRIKTGSYYRKGFGLAPRVLAWGVLGVFVYIIFTIFAAGAWPLLETLGFTTPPEGFGLTAILVSFTISVTVNVLWAPVLMVLHKVSDNRIENTNGSLLRYLTSKLDIAQLLREVDWNVMWGFVIKKTIPLFWIPAHTITFLLPPYLRVLCAAVLSVVLGVILSLAAQTARRRKQAPNVGAK
ncbi:MAG: hypothetical protein PWQ57_1330 [Desulfovibrionales bacterium]|nr:hypothetical protein [Desulfovibrionales bacterium]